MKLERQLIVYRGLHWRRTGPLEWPAEVHAMNILPLLAPLVTLIRSRIQYEIPK